MLPWERLVVALGAAEAGARALARVYWVRRGPLSFSSPRGGARQPAVQELVRAPQQVATLAHRCGRLLDTLKVASGEASWGGFQSRICLVHRRVMHSSLGEARRRSPCLRVRSAVLAEHLGRLE